MATSAEAVNSLSNDLNEKFTDLNNLLSDIGDNNIINTSRTLGQQTFASGSDITTPGNMLRVANATSQLGIEMGQEGDLGLKASQYQKQMAQKTA